MSGAATPTVSVVIAAYNAARYVDQTVRSVLAQTWTDWELILVDDGSSDDTAAVVAPHLADPRVRFFPIAHAGHAGAKNHALRRARGELVAFLDADDLWEPAKLARQLPLFTSDVGVVFTRRRMIDPDGREFAAGDTVAVPCRGRVTEALLLDNFICFSSAMIRRGVLDQVGLFDESLTYPIDYDLWLRVSLATHFDFVDEPLTLYRRGHGAMTETLRSARRSAESDRVTTRFLAGPGGQTIGRRAFRRAVVTRCCNRAYESRSDAPWRAAGWYARALWASPFCGAAWRGLAALPLTERGRRLARRAFRGGKRAAESA